MLFSTEAATNCFWMKGGIQRGSIEFQKGIFLHDEGKLQGGTSFELFWYTLFAAVDRFTDMYRYLPIYRLSADISVLQIRKMLIGIGNRYRPIRRPISVALQI